jgi:hypothetical protein
MKYAGELANILRNRNEGRKGDGFGKLVDAEQMCSVIIYESASPPISGASSSVISGLAQFHGTVKK